MDVSPQEQQEATDLTSPIKPAADNKRSIPADGSQTKLHCY